MCVWLLLVRQFLQDVPVVGRRTWLNNGAISLVSKHLKKHTVVIVPLRDLQLHYFPLLVTDLNVKCVSYNLHF